MCLDVAGGIQTIKVSEMQFSLVAATKAAVAADVNSKMIPKRKMKVAKDVKIEVEERALETATGKICVTGGTRKDVAGIPPTIWK